MSRRVYILEYDLYNMYGKYDEKNLISKSKNYYDISKRMSFIADNFYYDNVKGYGIDYSNDELDMEGLAKNM